jgi:enoyl-CoA hydratase/carnithine racemase
MPDSPLFPTKEGAIARIRFTLPDTLNAISIPLASAMLDALRDLGSGAAAITARGIIG